MDGLELSNGITKLVGAALNSGMPAEAIIGILEVRKLALDRFVAQRMAEQSPIVAVQSLSGLKPNGN